MNKRLYAYLQGAINMPVCRLSVNSYKMLSIGVGRKEYHNDTSLVTDYYGEWEFGSYINSWRILKNDKIIIGRDNRFENKNELNDRVNSISFGSFQEITIRNGRDVILNFSDSVEVQFLKTISDDDESFHIFCPNNIYIYLTAAGKLKIKKSDEPIDD